MFALSPVHLILLVVVLPIMFAPTIIAFSRKHRRKWLVFLLQILTNWTGVGFILALIWSIFGKTELDNKNKTEVFN